MKACQEGGKGGTVESRSKMTKKVSSKAARGVTEEETCGDAEIGKHRVLDDFLINARIGRVTGGGQSKLCGPRASARRKRGSGAEISTCRPSRQGGNKGKSVKVEGNPKLYRKDVLY